MGLSIKKNFLKYLIRIPCQAKRISFLVSEAIIFLHKNLGWVKNEKARAGVAQLVEHHLAKVDVEGSNPFARSTKNILKFLSLGFWGILLCP